MFGCSPQLDPGIALADEIQLTFLVDKVLRAGALHCQIDVPTSVPYAPDAPHAAALDRLALHAVGAQDRVSPCS